MPHQKDDTIPLHVLEENRRCPFGGGCRDCPCKGTCPILKPVGRLSSSDT